MTFIGGGGYKPSRWGSAYHARREEEVFGAGAAGPGKALALDTLVPTIDGFKTLGDVHPGDTVFSRYGKQVKVIAETEVQLDRPCFIVNIFHQRITADAEHEWVTMAATDFPNRTTRQIHESKWATHIPATGPIDFGPAKPLIVDPYVLGVCIIKGQPKDRSKFTGWDLELYTILKKCGYTLDEAGYRVSRIRERRDAINQLVAESGRRIPQQYMHGSFNQRMALVEGIMDGAGGRGPTVRGNDIPFLHDFYRLAASLNLAPRFRTGFGSGSEFGYYVSISSRKWRCSRRAAGKAHYKAERHRYDVANVVPTDSVPVKCIQVEGGTYCITEAYIPTHNSWVLLMDPIEQAWVEHLRCVQDERLIPASFPGDIREAIKANPLRWGQSEGHALHLRRTLTRLQETINRAHRVFPLIDPNVDWNEKRSTFTFTTGFQYQFGHCKDRNDHTNYLGQQYCVAEGTRILMADGSLRPIEAVEPGEYVSTLEGPKRVTALWDTGFKACVAATIEYRGATVGTQVHPTTHPVLLWPTYQSAQISSPGHIRTSRPTAHLGGEWLDFESLLDGLPRSPVTRVSRVDSDSGFVTSDGEHLTLEQLPPWFARVVLSERALQRQLPLAIGDGSGALTDLGTTKGCPAGCAFSCCLRDGQPRCPSMCAQLRAQLPGGVVESIPCQLPDARDGVPTHIQAYRASSYAHFYTGENRPLTEDVRMGTARFEYAGWRQTWDLTVEGANHYITETGLINCNTHLGFDELIEFLEQQYNLICSRCRSGDPVLVLMKKKRSMSNPKLADAKGESVEVDDPLWVRRYFVDPAPQGGKILRRKIKLESGEETWTRRLFLPAKLRDNPDKNFVRDYEIELRSRPKHIQECYLEGKWDSVIGSYFEHSYNPDIHRIRPFKIPQHWPIFRSLDWGYVSHGCLGYYAYDAALDVVYKFWECVFQRKKVTDFVKGILRPFEEANKLWNPFGGSLIYGPADTQIWEERGESALSKYQEFVQNGVDWCYADKRSREDNAQRVHERLIGHENFSRPPKLIFFENCKSSYQVLAGMQTDPNKPTEPLKGGFDHPYDETSYACAYIHGRTLDAPNYKGRAIDRDDDEPKDESRGNYGYWQG